MMSRHDRVCELFDSISEGWPERTELPGDRDLPEMSDLQAMLDSLPDEIQLTLFPEASDHRQRVLRANGDFQSKRSCV